MEPPSKPSEDLLAAAESVYDGWYADAGRIDWEDFLDRLETYSGEDLGGDLCSPRILAIQKHVRAYRRL